MSKNSDEEAKNFRCTGNCSHDVNLPYLLLTDAAKTGRFGMVLFCSNFKLVDAKNVIPRLFPMLENVDVCGKDTLKDSLMDDTPLLEIAAIISGLQWVLEEFTAVRKILVISDSGSAINFLRDRCPKTDESFKRSTVDGITRAYKIEVYNRALMDYDTIAQSFEKVSLKHCVRGYTWMADITAKKTPDYLMRRVATLYESDDYVNMIEMFQSIAETAIKAWGAVELENTARSPLDLKPVPDPVWHLFNLKNQRIRTLLENCTLDHEAALGPLQNTIQEQAASDAKGKQILDGTSHPNTIQEQAASDAKGKQILGGTSHPEDGLRRRYIHQLSDVLIRHIPDFWKTTLSVFSEKCTKSSQVAADSNVSAKGSDVKYLSHSFDEVYGMMQSTISLYEVKVLNTFHEFEESNILQKYMSDSIKVISKACQLLEAEESPPTIIVMALKGVHAEVLDIYIPRLCSWMRSTIEERSRDETWVTASIIERNKSPYRISCLPLAFHLTVKPALGQVHQMLQALKSDAAKVEDVFIHFPKIQESVRLSFLNCFLDFAGHLERIGSELSSELSSDLSPGSVIDPHQQLLMVLSNVGYCKDELFYELYNKYKHIWSHSRERDEEDRVRVHLAFSALEKKFLEQYKLSKANLIRTAAMKYLLGAGVIWGAAPSVKGVRDAAVELLHPLVVVHAEVFAGAKPLLDKTLGILVEGLIDTLLSIFNENESKELKSLDVNGFCQLMLELEYFKTVLNLYFTDDASESLKSLQGTLLEKAIFRGGEDVVADERQQGISESPDDLIALAQQYSSDLLEGELERTRINIACFAESLPMESVPEVGGALDSPSGITKARKKKAHKSKARKS